MAYAKRRKSYNPNKHSVAAVYNFTSSDENYTASLIQSLDIENKTPLTAKCRDMIADHALPVVNAFAYNMVDKASVLLLLNNYYFMLYLGQNLYSNTRDNHFKNILTKQSEYLKLLWLVIEEIKKAKDANIDYRPSARAVGITGKLYQQVTRMLSFAPKCIVTIAYAAACNETRRSTGERELPMLTVWADVADSVED